MSKNLKKIKNDSPHVSKAAKQGERGTVACKDAGILFNNNASKVKNLSQNIGTLSGVLS